MNFLKTLFIFFVIAFVSAAMPSISWAASDTKTDAPSKHHASITCQQCHGEAKPAEAKTFRCTTCHGSPEAVAKLTEGRGKRNPHNSPHWGTTMPCEECHKQHKASFNYCTNACHNWPEIVVK